MSKAKTESLERILSELWVLTVSEERSYESLRKRIPSRYPDKPNTLERVHFQTNMCASWGNYSVWRIISSDHPTTFCHHLSVSIPCSQLNSRRPQHGFHRSERAYQFSWGSNSKFSWHLVPFLDGNHIADFWRGNSRMFQIAPY